MRGFVFEQEVKQYQLTCLDNSLKNISVQLHITIPIITIKSVLLTSPILTYARFSLNVPLVSPITLHTIEKSNFIIIVWT